MTLQIIAIILSLTGYYYISKNPGYAYIAFIMLNGVLLLSTFQIALVINAIFSTYFLIKWIITNQKSL